MRVCLMMTIAVSLMAAEALAAEGEPATTPAVVVEGNKGSLLQVLNKMPEKLWPKLNESAQTKADRTTWFAEKVKGHATTWIMRVASVGEGHEVGKTELTGELVESPSWVPQNAAGQAVAVSCVVTLGALHVEAGDVVTMKGEPEDMGLYVIGTNPPVGRPDLPSEVIRASVVAGRAEVVGVKNGE